MYYDGEVAWLSVLEPKAKPFVLVLNEDQLFKLATDVIAILERMHNEAPRPPR